MSAIESLDVKRMGEELGALVEIRYSSVFKNNIILTFLLDVKPIVFELADEKETIRINYVSGTFPPKEDVLMCYDALIAFIEESPAFRLRVVTGEKVHTVGYDPFLQKTLKERKTHKKSEN